MGLTEYPYDAEEEIVGRSEGEVVVPATLDSVLGTQVRDARAAAVRVLCFGTKGVSNSKLALDSWGAAG